MPKVSVILTSYNHDKYLREAIESVLNQTFQDFELIIWDDGSVDDSWEIIQSYSDPRIQAFQNPQNNGPVFGINKAIFDISCGEYIAIHHSDDVWELDKLAKQVDFLEAANQNIGAVFSNAQPIDQRGIALTDQTHFYHNIFSQPNRSRHEWLRYFFLTGNALCHPSLLIRKQCYLDCGAYRDIFAQVPDFDMWMRLCLKYEIYILPERLVKFRVMDNEANTSGNRPETRVRGLYEYYKLLANYRTISSFDDLIKILPSAQKYYLNEATDANFALAMVALEAKPFPFTELFGQDILFEMISDPKQAENIKQFYHFDHHSFVELTAKHDVFSREEVANLCKDIANLNQVITEREIAVATLNQVVAEHEADIAHLQQVIVDRDEQLNQITVEHEAILKSIRSSSSWKITAPLRFLGHLLNGNFDIARQVIRNVMSKPLDYVDQQCTRAMIMPEIINDAAINAIIMQRCSMTQHPLTVDPLSFSALQQLPKIDISVVTYNSSRWINAFIDSLIKLDYPQNLLSIRFVDNSSTDSTLNDLQAIAPTLRAAGCTVEIMKRPNHGYGSGHNAAITLGNAPFCLVTNIDLTFECDALSRIIAVAATDDETVAAWEMRQKPYEHPKYYDPVTGITNWNSHACVLLRRSALQQVGFYDDTLFMYGEDVELSYRLRRAGFLLRYCPQAVVWHYSYEDVTKIKPLQYTGSTFANLYLRLKYGNRADAEIVPWLGLSLLRTPAAYAGARSAVIYNLLRLLIIAPKAMLSKQPSQAYFPFRVWDYELTREGAFVEQLPLPSSLPLVSIITRTYRGRELYLRQALLSAAHQTYPNIECIVVEDGGDTMQTVVDNLNQVTQRTIRFIALPKCGRSATGNAGLAAATGRWCVFLDDDDLLFADHVETLVSALLNQPNAAAAYSPAWEIVTDSSKLQSGKYVEVSHKTPAALCQDFDYEILKHHNYMAIQSVLFERHLFEERGGFEEDMDALEDWLLWIKYAEGNCFKYVPKVTSMYRVPASTVDMDRRQAAFDTAYTVAQQKLSYLEAVKSES